MNKYEDLFLDGYELVCDRMVDILRKRKELEAEYKETKEELLNQSGGERMENGIRVTLRKRDGAVDLKRMVEDGYIDEDLIEHYRKPPVEFFEVRSY